MPETLAAKASVLADCGIDVVQLGDSALTYFCDRALMSGESTHDERLRRYWDIGLQLPGAINAINHVLDRMPCLKELRADRLNLAFACNNTGDVSDLGLPPGHLNVGMGVVDVRVETPQTVEEIASLASGGAERVVTERIALNPRLRLCPGCRKAAVHR